MRFHPDPLLRRSANPVECFDTVLLEFVWDLLVFMRAHRGIGLAAPQVGVLQRIVVADPGQGPVCLVNPKILARDGAALMAEGCLSLPGVKVDVKRNAQIEIRGTNPQGKRVQFEANGLLARVLQHEVDHLNGVLICDHGVPLSVDETGAQAATEGT